MKHHEEANKANVREDQITATRDRIVELARELAKVPGAAGSISLAGTIGSIVLAVAELEQLERQSSPS